MGTTRLGATGPMAAYRPFVAKSTQLVVGPHVENLTTAHRSVSALSEAHRGVSALGEAHRSVSALKRS